MARPRVVLGAGMVGIVVLAAALADGYATYIGYRFTEVIEGRVFRSAAMPTDVLLDRVMGHGIRSVVDLRTEPEAVEAERRALASAGVRHFSIPSDQVPSPETVDAFLAVMAERAEYPVLIHCHHGRGRAVLFAALYRIEFEGWENDRARLASRPMAVLSSFSASEPKGEYLVSYVPRRQPGRRPGPVERR